MKFSNRRDIVTISVGVIACHNVMGRNEGGQRNSLLFNVFQEIFGIEGSLYYKQNSWHPYKQKRRNKKRS